MGPCFLASDSQYLSTTSRRFSMSCRLWVINIFVTCVVLQCFIWMSDAQPLAASSPFIRNRPTYLPDRRRHPTQWGAWSEWGPCSRTCGQGVTKRTRVCLVWTGHNFAQTYITLCTGSDVNHKLCTLSECPPGTLDYRHWQCLTAGSRLSKSSSMASVTWFPAQESNGRPCDLHCRSSQGLSRNMGTALDGTRCQGNGTRVCIRGLCQSVGCDGVVESRAIVDVCGRCTREGVNTTCSLVTGTYTTLYPDRSSDVEGYNFIVAIPKGSTHLYVKEKSNNMIALRDRTGTFIINGPFTISKNGVYTVAGTDFKYRRLPDGKETLESEGPLARDAMILLMYKEINTGVYYHFWKPKRPSASDDPSVNVFQPETPKPHIVTTTKTTPTTTPTTTTTTPTTTTTTTTRPTTTTTTRRTTTKRVRTTSSFSEDAIWELLMGELDKGDEDGNIFPNTTTSQPTTTTAKPCEPCSRMKDRLFHFCDSDFVSHVRINHKAYVGGETRYDITIFRSYKNKMKLLDREFLWAPNLCNCPRLRVRRDYVIMGFMERHRDRELKLIVTPYAYVRRYSEKQHQRMLKLEDFVKC